MVLCNNKCSACRLRHVLQLYVLYLISYGPCICFILCITPRHLITHIQYFSRMLKSIWTFIIGSDSRPLLLCDLLNHCRFTVLSNHDHLQRLHFWPNSGFRDPNLVESNPDFRITYHLKSTGPRFSCQQQTITRVHYVTTKNAAIAWCACFSHGHMPYWLSPITKLQKPHHEIT